MTYPISRAAIFLLAIASLGCTHAPFGESCRPWGRPEPVDGNCYRRHAVEVYLEELQQHFRPVFQLPPDFNEDAHVEVRFALDLDGTVVDRCIMRSNSTALAKSVLAALDAASLPPIPRYARCLAGAEIRRFVDTARH